MVNSESDKKDTAPAFSIPKLKKQSLGQEATTLLRQMILDGRFVNGQRLVEDKIANDLGISRTPLREALHRLAQEGLLQKRYSGGYELKTTNMAELQDAITLRSLLESHAASLAAQRASLEHKNALSENLKMFKDAVDAEDIPALIRLNEAFHAILRESTGFTLLTQMLGELDNVVERMLRCNIKLNDAGQWSYKEHYDIFQAINDSNATIAAEFMRLHVQHGGDKLLALLK